MRLIWAVVLLLVATTALAESSADILDRSICAPDGISLGGYDPVSYWQSDAPVQGLAEWVADHEGATYRFSSEDNLTLFTAEPDRYLPRYRGWCAATLAMGNLTCPDYTNFKIENGELFLFEVIGFTNGRDFWDSDPVLNKQNADSHFLKLLNE